MVKRIFNRNYLRQIMSRILSHETSMFMLLKNYFFRELFSCIIAVHSSITEILKRNEGIDLFRYIKVSAASKVIWFFTCIVMLFSCGHESNKSLNIFVAASLNPSVSKAVKADTLNVLNVNAASSGILAKQIQAGAPCDIYFSANVRWITYLCEIGAIDSTQVRTVAFNKLVFAVPAKDSLLFSESALWTEKIKTIKSVAIGNPDYVPVGEYAVQALKNLNIYALLDGKFNETKDAPSALKLVELGEVEGGFLYKTDAMASEKVRIVTEIPDSLYAPIEYFVAPTSIKGKIYMEESGFLSNLKNAFLQNGFKVK